MNAIPYEYNKKRYIFTETTQTFMYLRLDMNESNLNINVCI